LISDIIDISKVEAGAMEVYCEPFFLHEIINEAINNIQHMLNGKNISIEDNVSEGIRLNTDRKRLLQCLVNLLSNAVKYTDAGKIIVSSKAVGENIELLVTDTGIGISKKDQLKLFKAFERINTRLTVKEGGTGLGLYLTKRIISELLKGIVEVESREGVGSTFRLRIPMILNVKRNE
jgi:signal transduction histidine kinase